MTNSVSYDFNVGHLFKGGTLFLFVNMPSQHLIFLPGFQTLLPVWPYQVCCDYFFGVIPYILNHNHFALLALNLDTYDLDKCPTTVICALSTSIFAIFILVE